MQIQPVSVMAIGVVASAAIVAAGVTAVQGMYMQQERYNKYYANGVNPSNFFTDQNPLMYANPDERVRSFEPSVAEVTFLDAIDFHAQERPAETRIFTGIVDVSECYDGDYIFRITSDDASHMVVDGQVVIDNGGSHSSLAKMTKLTLKKGQMYNVQVWWGNNAQGSNMKFEFCKKSAVQAEAEDLLAVLNADLPGGVSSDLLSDEELAMAGCDFTTDLSSIFKKHDMAVVTRRDFNGYFHNDIKFFDANDFNKLGTKFLPSGVGYEAGGVIALNAKDGGIEGATQMSFQFSVPIVPRISGVHTFWVESDDASFLYIGGKEVVNNEGWHSPRWRKNSIYLEKGVKTTLDVYYGNDGGTGMLTVKWEDPLSSEPMASLMPIMST